MAKKKQIRDKRITVRLTEEQFKELEKRRGTIPRSEYLYLLILEWLKRESDIDKQLQEIQERLKKESKYYIELQKELGKLGLILNQIAKDLKKRRLKKEEREILMNLAAEAMKLLQKIKANLLEGKDGNPQEN